MVGLAGVLPTRRISHRLPRRIIILCRRRIRPVQEVCRALHCLVRALRRSGSTRRVRFWRISLSRCFRVLRVLRIGLRMRRVRRRRVCILMGRRQEGCRLRGMGMLRGNGLQVRAQVQARVRDNRRRRGGGRELVDGVGLF